MHLRIRLISITTNVVLAKTFLLHLESLVDTGLIVSFTKTVVIDLIAKIFPERNEHRVTSRSFRDSRVLEELLRFTRVTREKYEIFCTVYLSFFFFFFERK